MNCPLCNAAANKAFEVKGYAVDDCSSCGHRFAQIVADETHVRAHYGDEYFSGGGAGYSDYTAESKLLVARGRMYADKIARHTEPGVMLDVGAAAGFLLKGFVEKGWQGEGLEPNSSMAEYGRQRVGVDVREGAFETFEAERRYDLVSMIQVVAHFYSPAAAFEKAHQLLKPGGLLLVETWDNDSLSARFFGRNWHEYSPPTVLHWFSRHRLAEYLLRVGFEQIDGGRPSKKISGGHVRSLLRYRIGDNVLLKLIPENINFPYPSEDLFWALFRRT